MNPLAVAVVAGAAAAVIGEAMRRHLQLLTYRRSEEKSLPDPGPRWWVPVAAATAVASLTARFLDGRPEVLWMLLPLALAGTWLAAVDLDVRRLPDRVLLPLLAWEAAVTVGLLATGRHSTGLDVMIGGAASLLMLWPLHWFSNGGLGFGDVTLGAAVAAATSAVSLTTLFWAFLASFTAAALWGLITRRQDLALGPWLVLGAVTTTVLLP